MVENFKKKRQIIDKLRTNQMINSEVENNKYSFYYQNNEALNNIEVKSEENSYTAEKNRALSDPSLSPKSN